MASCVSEAVSAVALRPTDPSPAAVRLRGVSRRFGDHRIVNRLDLDIRVGEFVVLLGASGSGKTTLLRALCGLDRFDEGEWQLPQVIATVFQEPRLMPWKRVWRNVSLGVRTPDARQRALRALTEVGLGHRIDAYPATLSGGEAQRVALARSLVREPQLFLLDEPFASLDALTRIRMHELLLQLWRTHRPAILLVTHDVEEAVLLADRVIVLVDGKIAKQVPIGLSRPRSVGGAEFGALRQRLLGMLGVSDGHDPWQ